MNIDNKDTIALINKVKADMTRIGIAEEDQTIAAVCVFARAAQMSHSNKTIEDSIKEMKRGVMDYDYEF